MSPSVEAFILQECIFSTQIYSFIILIWVTPFIKFGEGVLP